MSRLIEQGPAISGAFNESAATPLMISVAESVEDDRRLAIDTQVGEGAEHGENSLTTGWQPGPIRVAADSFLNPACHPVVRDLQQNGTALGMGSFVYGQQGSRCVLLEGSRVTAFQSPCAADA